MKQQRFGRWIEVRKGCSLPRIVTAVVGGLRANDITISPKIDSYRRRGRSSVHVRGRNSRDFWEARGRSTPKGTFITLKFRPWTSSRWQMVIDMETGVAVAAVA
jgi:hypothetical protein